MSELTTLLITAEHVRDGVYVGPDVSDITGHIEIAADLGWLTFQGGIKASGRIRALSGSGIAASGGISAGWDITAGCGISAGEDITAGCGISAGEDITAGRGISAGHGITAGRGISAGHGITAGRGISAGHGISAGWEIAASGGITAGAGISAGDGITAGLRIKCSWLSARLRIFAGLVNWRLPRDGEDEIVGELRSGTIASGRLVTPQGRA